LGPNVRVGGGVTVVRDFLAADPTDVMHVVQRSKTAASRTLQLGRSSA